jgi:hypothetical protein
MGLFSRVSPGNLMFSRNWIASLLVVVYGLTAGIGPFWHSHSGGCGCCLSTRSTSLPTAQPTETAAENSSSRSTCTSGCAFCAKRSTTEKTSANDEPGTSLDLERFGEDGEHDNDSCVVCDFYGKTYFSTLGFEIHDRSQIVTSVPNFVDHAPTLLEPLAAARDPPIE